MRKAISVLLLAMLLLPIFIAITTSNTASAQAVYNGPWVGSIVIRREPDIAVSVEKLIAGEYDVLFDEIGTATLFERIKKAGLPYTVSYGLYYEITLNYMCKRNETTGEVIEPVFPNPSKLPHPDVQGKILFNPFCNPRIRYAMHFLIDRTFIAERIGEGLLVPRYTAITPAFPDYGRLADVIIPLEEQLKYDIVKARSIIAEEMTKMGAELIGGKWYYKGQPVVLIFLIRVEDVRKQIGDYVASQLERLGFTVLRYYGRSAELSPYWIRADPADGTFHLYTGGWITTAVDRDQGSNFGYFYTKLGRPEPLWQKIINTPEFYEVAEKLYYNKYSSVEERKELMAKALELSLTVENQRIFIANRIAVWARRPNVEISSDLAGGYSGSWLWPWTARFTDLPLDRLKTSTLRIAYRDLLIEPWNPIGGSNWIYDQTIIRATGETALYPDPYSGLYWPHRITKAEVYVNEGLPVGKTLDWVTLYKVPEADLKVPEDAWLLYDYRNERLVTVGEVKANPGVVKELFGIEGYEPPTTALAKVVIYYDPKIFHGYTWHDGSQFDIADILYSFIITFDRASIGSKLYDDAAVPSFKAWFPTFKGIKILSTDPLVMEVYTDVWYLDAEWIVNDAYWWPYYSQGPGAWHVVELAAEAERRGLLAFTESKAKATGVDRTDLLSPRTFENLLPILDEFITNKYVPYSKVLGNYVSPDVALKRWQNLKAFYVSYGHLWVGNGPFVLKQASKDMIVLEAYRQHIDPANKYAFLAKPPVPVVTIHLPPTIYQGRDLEVTVEVTDEAGNVYPEEYIESISYIIAHGGGFVSGKAEPIGGGLWKIYIPAEEVSKMMVGKVEFTAIAVSKIVGMPGVSKETSVLTVPPELILEKVGEVAERMQSSINAVASELHSSVNQINTQIALLNQTIGATMGAALSDLAISLKDLANSMNVSLTRLSTTLATSMQVTGSAINTTSSEMKTLSTKIDMLTSKLESQTKAIDEGISSVEAQISALASTVQVVLIVAIISIIVGIVNAVLFLRRK